MKKGNRIAIKSFAIKFLGVEGSPVAGHPHSYESQGWDHASRRCHWKPALHRPNSAVSALIPTLTQPVSFLY